MPNPAETFPSFLRLAFSSLLSFPIHDVPSTFIPAPTSLRPKPHRTIDPLPQLRLAHVVERTPPPPPPPFDSRLLLVRLVETANLCSVIVWEWV